MPAITTTPPLATRPASRLVSTVLGVLLLLALAGGPAKATSIAIPSIQADDLASTPVGVKLTNSLYRAFNGSDIEVIERRKVEDGLRSLGSDIARLSDPDLAMLALLADAENILLGSLRNDQGRFSLTVHLYNADRNAVILHQSLPLANTDAAIQSLAEQLVVLVLDALAAAQPTKPTFAETTPLPPEELEGTASTMSVNLRWEPPPGPLRTCKIYRSEDPDGPFRFLAAVAGASFSDTTVQPDSTYTYRVKAVDEDGRESEPSDPFTITTEPGPDSPVITEIESRCQAVALSVTPSPLTDPAALEAIAVYRKEPTGYVFIDIYDFEPEKPATYGKPVPQTVVVPIEGDDGDCARFVATVLDDEDRESAFSTPRKGCSLDNVVDLEADATRRGRIRLTIRHEEPAVRAYHILRAEEDGAPKEIATLRVRSGSRRLVFTDRDIAEDATYTYRIVKEDQDGRRTDPAPPLVVQAKGRPEPVEIQEISGGARSLTIVWECAADDEVRYVVQVERDGEPYTTKKVDPGDEGCRLRLRWLDPGRYCAEITVKDQDDLRSPASERRCAQVGAPEDASDLEDGTTGADMEERRLDERIRL